MPSRTEFEAREAATLAPYAMPSRDSRGRRHSEPEHPFRMAFQRDRDRISHSTAFRRLNLSFEVREGIVKHSTRYDRPQVHEFDATLAPCLEAQIVDFADEIAYNAHDIDDGLKSGMLDPDELGSVSLWAEAMAAVSRKAPGAPAHVLRYQAVRAIIDRLVTDLVDHLLARLAERPP